MVFSKEVVKGICTWKWGGKRDSKCCKLLLLGHNGSWDSHVQKVMKKNLIDCTGF